MKVRYFLLASALVVLPQAARAQSCSNCLYFRTGYAISCSDCQSKPDDNQLAAWVASKAVEWQQSGWWGEKKVEDLSRSEVDERTARLTALEKWTKTLSNHVFAHAYEEWVRARSRELEERRQVLDNLDVAKSLITGLPVPPK